VIEANLEAQGQFDVSWLNNKQEELLKQKSQIGQISLLVLLIAAVITTLGLSVSQKTILETKIDTDEEALKQAFNSAESGIEYYLGSGSVATGGTMTYTSPDGKSQANVTVSSLGGGNEIDYDMPVLPGNYEYYWLAAHQSDGSLDLTKSYTGKEITVCVKNTSSTKLETALFYINAGEYGIKRELLDYSGASDNCGGYGKALKINVDVSGTKVLLALSPLAVSTNLKIKTDGTDTFESQGSTITAIGEVLNVGTAMAPVRSRVAVQDRYKLMPFLLNPLTGSKRVLSQ
jgi:Tfp pilus assembly protein PilX